MESVKVLTLDSTEWINANYPGLHVDEDNTTVRGEVEIIASYNFESNKLLNLSDGRFNSNEGLILSGKFQIIIQKREDGFPNLLPDVLILNKEIEKIAARHFNAKPPHAACLCGPFEEARYINSGYRFEEFFEQIIVPFLYGQLYFSKHGKWPWEEYGHGVVGVLESYYNAKDKTITEQCARILLADKSWPRIRYLLQHENISESTLCLCGSKKKFIECHKLARLGLILLKKNLRSLNLVRHF